MRRSQRGDPNHFGDAARDAGIGLQDVGGACFDQFPEVEAREQAFSGGNRNVGGRANFGHGGDRIRVDRFFKPGEVAIFHAPAKPLGFAFVPGAVGVRHQLDAGTERLTRGAHAGQWSFLPSCPLNRSAS